MRFGLVYVVAGSAAPGTCRACGRAIVWHVTPKGKNLPLNPGAVVLHTHTHVQTGVRYAAYGSTDVHFATCAKLKPRVAAAR